MVLRNHTWAFPFSIEAGERTVTCEVKVDSIDYRNPTHAIIVMKTFYLLRGNYPDCGEV